MKTLFRNCALAITSFILLINSAYSQSVSLKVVNQTYIAPINLYINGVDQGKIWHNAWDSKEGNYTIKSGDRLQIISEGLPFQRDICYTTPGGAPGTYKDKYQADKEIPLIKITLFVKPGKHYWCEVWYDGGASAATQEDHDGHWINP